MAASGPSAWLRTNGHSRLSHTSAAPIASSGRDRRHDRRAVVNRNIPRARGCDFDVAAWLRQGAAASAAASPAARFTFVLRSASAAEGILDGGHRDHRAISGGYRVAIHIPHRSAAADSLADSERIISTTFIQPL